MAKVLDRAFYFGPKGFPIAVWEEDQLSPSAERPDYTQVEHSHNFWEIIIIRSGSGKHWLEGRSFQVKAGDVFLIQEGQKHYFHDLRELKLINILYDPEGLRLPETELRKLPGYGAMFLLEPLHRKQHDFSSSLRLTPIDLAKAIQKAEKIGQACKDKKDGWEVISLTALQDLIIYLSLSYTGNETHDAASLLRVADVIALLEKEYMNPISLDRLVQTANMSKGNLIRIFKTACKQTPVEYLLDIRIKHAMDELLNTNLSISEIAYQVGFNDRNYFSRQFRLKTGLSPREFRQMY